MGMVGLHKQNYRIAENNTDDSIELNALLEPWLRQ